MGCLEGCAQGGSPVAQQQYLALVQCVFQFCVLDASRQEVAQCIAKSVSDPTECATQMMACQ
jgi:hypothetical protein